MDISFGATPMNGNQVVAGQPGLQPALLSHFLTRSELGTEPDNPWFVMDSSTNNIFAEMLPDAATLGMNNGLWITHFWRISSCQNSTTHC